MQPRVGFDVASVHSIAEPIAYQEELRILRLTCRRTRSLHALANHSAGTRPRITNATIRQLLCAYARSLNEFTHSLRTKLSLDLHGCPFMAVLSSSIAINSRSMLAVSDGTRGSAVVGSQGEISPALFFRLTRRPELNVSENRSM